jgi:hypothetical protein
MGEKRRKNAVPGFARTPHPARPAAGEDKPAPSSPPQAAGWFNVASSVASSAIAARVAVPMVFFRPPESRVSAGLSAVGLVALPLRFLL